MCRIRLATSSSLANDCLRPHFTRVFADLTGTGYIAITFPIQEGK